MLNWINNSAKILLVTRILRMFGNGFIGVILGLFFLLIGLNFTEIGFMLFLILLGASFFTILAGFYSSQFGLKKFLLFSTVLSIFGIILFLITTNIFFLAIGAFSGFISPSGKEIGPQLSLEHVLLSNNIDNSHRTKLFSYWNIGASFSRSLGALFSAIPILLQNLINFNELLSFKFMFVVFLVIQLIIFLLYLQLPLYQPPIQKTIVRKETKKITAKLSLLFGLDAMGGGFVLTSLVTLWFSIKFSANLDILSITFFLAGLFETASFYLAIYIAKKIGLLKTMVFSHIPSNILLILVPFMPTLGLALIVYILRFMLSQMDVPTRQSYIVAIVEENERPYVTTITTTARLVTSSISSSISSTLLTIALSAPFLFAGVIKIIYDTTIYYNFRHIKPPEERQK